MNLGLENKVVFITGGTGDIGNKIVNSFIEENAHVIFTYHQAEEKALLLMQQHRL